MSPKCINMQCMNIGVIHLFSHVAINCIWEECLWNNNNIRCEWTTLLIYHSHIYTVVMFLFILYSYSIPIFVLCWYNFHVLTVIIHYSHIHTVFIHRSCIHILLIHCPHILTVIHIIPIFIFYRCMIPIFILYSYMTPIFVLPLAAHNGNRFDYEYVLYECTLSVHSRNTYPRIY